MVFAVHHNLFFESGFVLGCFSEALLRRTLHIAGLDVRRYRVGYGHEDICEAGLWGQGKTIVEQRLDRCIENLKDYSSPVLLILTILHSIEASPSEGKYGVPTEYVAHPQESRRCRLALPTERLFQFSMS